MKFPKKCIVDTNVPKTANLAMRPESDVSVSDNCIDACIEAIEHVTKNRALVMDASNEIYDEYRQQLSLTGEPGIGDRFMKWVNDHRHNPAFCDRIHITKNGDTYLEFPDHEGLGDFDKSDRKFVAVSNAHPRKPSILQATDSKWWGWKDVLKNIGIKVVFLCPEYVQEKYAKK